MPVLNDVVLAYVKVQQPDFKYQSTTEKEWSVNAIVSKAQAKEWNKKFKKQPAKVVENEDFEAHYKIEIPEAFADQDEQYVLTLKRSTTYKDGNPVADETRPRVFLKGRDGKLNDITKTKLVANGSVGAISYNVAENDFGTFAGLKAVRVDELIEYEKASGGGYEELGEIASLADDFSDIPERAPRASKSDSESTPVGEPKKVVKAPVKAAVKPKKVVVEQEEDGDNSGSPF